MKIGDKNRIELDWLEYLIWKFYKANIHILMWYMFCWKLFNAPTPIPMQNYDITNVNLPGIAGWTAVTVICRYILKYQ